MTCPKCQTSNDSKSRFCRNCGAGLNALAPTVGFADVADSNGSASRPAGKPEQANLPGQVHEDDADTRVSTAAFDHRRNTVRSYEPEGATAVQIGRILDDKYRIEEKIGIGGMGTVYRAARLLIGDEVAIKILKPEHVSEPGAKERFRREAQAAARIKNDNAVIIFDFGITSDGLVYLVMELLHGESLRQLIKREGPLEAFAAVDILNQVCNALDEAHRHQVVHRDLKPDNIIVRTTPHGLRVKVLDFGIAKLRDLPGTTMTQVGAVMGTPRYMSPEQCLGDEIDHRSDIYSLGIVLYEMLAGEVPFRKPTSSAVVVQQVQQQPPPLREVNPAVSPAVEAVVLQALQKRREDRPQTASALATAFSAAVNARWSPPAYGASPGPGVGHSGSPGFVPTMVVNQPPRITIDVPHPNPSAGSLGQVGATAPNKVSVALIVVGALGLLAIGALVAVLLVGGGGPSSDTRTAETTPSPRPSVDIGRTTPADPTPASTPGSVERPTAPETRPTASPPPELNPSIPDINRDYYGTMGSQQVHLKLEKRGSRMTGFAQTRNYDTLSGTVDNDGYFTLEGRENGGRVTGIYRGQLHRDGSISGAYWTYPNGTGRTPIRDL